VHLRNLEPLPYSEVDVHLRNLEPLPYSEVGGDGVRSGGGAVRAEVAAARGGRVVGVVGERSGGVAEVAQASAVEAVPYEPRLPPLGAGVWLAW